MMKVPFLDLKISSAQRRKEYLGAIEKVFIHGQFVIGPEVDEFEKRAAEYVGAEYAVAVGSGTDALFIALKALGIGGGDEVIIPAMTFVATANAVRMTGAVPVLADINDNFNISADSIVKLINSRTKVIMPVHYAGKIADMESIQKLAEDNNLLVVEDASQAFGAMRHGKYSGTFGKLGCISLNPMKILGAVGEAGIVFTEDKELYEKLNMLRYNGLRNRSECVEVSLNCKPDTIIAAVLLTQLEQVDKIIQRRRKIAEYYRDRLPGWISCPDDDDDGCRDVYYTFTVKVRQRDRLLEHLRQEQIETKIYHTVIADESAYHGITGETQNAKRLYNCKLALPCNEKLTDEQIEFVCNEIIRFYNHA